MRYQEPIYIQNDHAGVRNKDILNVNMSSDLCIFEAPLFYLSGASKIDCTGTTSSYIITTGTSLSLDFQFTANTNSFTANSSTFKYEIYKFNNESNTFNSTPVYQSQIINYSAFSGTNILNQNVPISSLNIDGEYIIKGYYDYTICTDFLNKLNKKIDTLKYKIGSNYGIYDNNLDYYFLAMRSADTPILARNGSNSPNANQLFQQVILPNAGENNIIITNTYSGDFILTLNGVVLAKDQDYSVSGSIVTLSSNTVSEDIITIIYTTSGGNTLVGDNYLINSPIVSGITNNQGTNNVYYNTTTNKYEVYTNLTPVDGGSILVMLNGATLASGIDFYQSSSNPKRIILEGDLKLEDIITLVYFPRTNVVNDLFTNNPSIVWSINNPPQLINGFFSLQVSTNNNFSSFYYTGKTDYVVGQTIYMDNFTASGSVGTKLYYRIKNEKNYETICGGIINSTSYSEIIPLTITTNGINTY